MLLPSATIISVYNVRALINEWAHYIHTVQCTIDRFHQIRIWLKQKKMWFSINVNAKSSNYIKFFNGKYFLFSFFFSVVFLIDESQMGKSKSPEQPFHIRDHSLGKNYLQPHPFICIALHIQSPMTHAMTFFNIQLRAQHLLYNFAKASSAF